MTVGAYLLGEAVVEATRADPAPTPRAPAIPNTDTRVCSTCPRAYGVRVHAQGRDCGGTTSSTIGAPPVVSPATPIPTAAGVAVSNATWAMLTRRQRNIRTLAKARLEAYILARPPAGYLGEKTFRATDPSGGKRYDMDSYGPSPNFIV